MTTLEQVLDDGRDNGTTASEAGLDHETVADDAAAGWHLGQRSLVAPPALQPRARLLDEPASVVDALERKRVSIEGQHAEEQEPALDNHLPGSRSR